MCQPGRPSPHGDGNAADAGSSLLRPFQSAKSRGSRLARGSASAAASMLSMLCLVSLPYAGQLFTSK